MTTIIERDRSDSSSAATVIIAVIAIFAILAIGYAMYRYLPPAGARTDEPSDSLNINVNGLPSGYDSSAR